MELYVIGAGSVEKEDITLARFLSSLNL